MSGARVLALRPEQLDEDQRALRDKILSGPRASGPQAFDLADVYYRMLAQLLDVFGVGAPVAGSHKEVGLIVPRP